MSDTAAALDAFHSLPSGNFRARYEGTEWLVSKSILVGGQAQKFLARELGGNGYVSMNVYRLKSGAWLLKPCEMPRQKAERFLLALELSGSGDADQAQ